MNGPGHAYSGSATSLATSSTITLKGELPLVPLTPTARRPGSGGVPDKPLPSPTKREIEATVRLGQLATQTRREPSFEDDDQVGEEEYADAGEGYDTAMLDSVILPSLSSLIPRVSTLEGKQALAALQRAFVEAERLIPGLANEFVSEVVDSVEHVEDEA